MFVNKYFSVFLWGGNHLFLSISKLGHKSKYITNFITKGIQRLYVKTNDTISLDSWPAGVKMGNILKTSVISMILLNHHPVRYSSITEMRDVSKCFT